MHILLESGDTKLLIPSESSAANASVMDADPLALNNSPW